MKGEKHLIMALIIVSALLAVSAVVLLIMFFNSSRESGYFALDGYISDVVEVDSNDMYVSVEDIINRGCDESNRNKVKEKYNKNPEKFKIYRADITLTNNSDRAFPCVWAVYPGNKVEFDYLDTKLIRSGDDAKIYIDPWMGEGLFTLGKGDKQEAHVYFLMDISDMSDAEISSTLDNLHIDIQANISDKNWKDERDIIRDMYFVTPIYRNNM